MTPAFRTVEPNMSFKLAMRTPEVSGVRLGIAL